VITVGAEVTITVAACFYLIQIFEQHIVSLEVGILNLCISKNSQKVFLSNHFIFMGLCSKKS